MWTSENLQISYAIHWDINTLLHGRLIRKILVVLKKHSVQKYLKRIEDAAGRVNRDPTEKQRKRRKESGNPFTKKYYVCRKYLDVDGLRVYNATQWCCVSCWMPICAMDRTLEGSNTKRKLPCLHEHLYAQVNDPVACLLYWLQVFPKCHQVPFHKAEIEKATLMLILIIMIFLWQSNHHGAKISTL